MPEISIVKRIHKWKPFKGKSAGRTKSRWDDDVRNDLKKTKLVKWAEQVQDRSKWKDTVEKAKTLSELYRHRRECHGALRSMINNTRNSTKQTYPKNHIL